MLVNVIWNGGLLLGLAEGGEGDMGEMGHANDFTQQGRAISRKDAKAQSIFLHLCVFA